MYQQPNDVLEFFHLFLNDELSLGYLKLDSKFKNFENLEEKFLEEVFRLEQEEEDDLHLKQTSYLLKLKSKFSKEPLKLEEIRTQPLSAFFKYKCILIRKIYKSLSDSEMVRMVIFLFDDKTVKQRLSKYMKVSLKDVYETLKLIDQIK